MISKRDNRRAYGDDVLNAENAQRNKQAESGFRAIGSGTQRVQTEYRDTRGRANLFAAFIAGLQRLTEDQIRNIHRYEASDSNMRGEMRL